jgi:RNA polymerase sigma-70 factor (ECF subfamily)
MDHAKPNSVPESALIRRAAAGDQRALADLLAAHRDRLRRLVTLRLDRRVRGRVDPSDIIQDAYVDAAAALTDYSQRGDMSFFLWLRWLTGMKINAAHRIHLGFQVRDAAREVSIDRGAMPQATSAALAAQLVGRLTSASAVAIRRERKARLQEAIDLMDPLDREILVLRHFEELTNGEAAQTLGLQESAASKRFIRALRKLKDILRSMPGGTAEFKP